MPQNVYQIAVECENAQGYSTLIDNFSISSGVLAVKDVSNLSKSSIKFYPNPVKNSLNYTGREKIGEVSIYDASGKKIKTQKTDSESGNIDVSDLHNGMYIITGKTNGGTDSFKIIKN